MIQRGSENIQNNECAVNLCVTMDSENNMSETSNLYVNVAIEAYESNFEFVNICIKEISSVFYRA